MHDRSLRLIHESFSEERELKSVPIGGLWRLHHKDNGKLYIFRRHDRIGEIYRKLLGMACPHLPQVLDLADEDGKVAVLEEHVSGGRLGRIVQRCTQVNSLKRYKSGLDLLDDLE